LEISALSGRAFARRVLAGDEAAFRELFDQFFPRLYRYALVRLDGNQEAATEIVQQTFCKAIEHLASYRGEAALYAWFCRICRNTLIDYCRKRKFEVLHVVSTDGDPATAAVLEALTVPLSRGPEALSEQREIRQLVQAALDALPEHYGDVLEWKYVEEMSVAEIAARLELGYKAAESLLTRARSAFREAIRSVVELADRLPAAGVARSDSSMKGPRR
jgi:RNA polymerase sigma-70 factor, ECF subfamily